ncbi:utp8p [Saccharomyces arboricola H-6]|uniref:Utp8p n=1 Tax=Saccharomyces arboricola (strain H-6 / AS 2.3317 / CBS 10644) TaxID=1160507 RepID=J8Q1V7_SACAR|nr:utp8p [Saccharomyces arboricola H-6]
MPYFSQPFRLATLPKIASLSNFSLQADYVQVADGTFNESTNIITLGISGSSISQYIINPTPKLTFDYPIPSTNIITACNAAESQVKIEKDAKISNNNDNHHEDVVKVQWKRDIEIWSFASMVNKGNYTLNVITKALKDSKDASNDELIENGIENKAYTSTDDFLSQHKIKTKGKVVNIKIDAKNSLVIAVLQNGLVEYYDFELKLLYSFDVSYNNLKYAEWFTENETEFMFVLCPLEDDKVCYKLFQLSDYENGENSPIKELSSTIIEGFSYETSKICYQFGKLYKLNQSKIFVYSLPHCLLQQIIDLPLIHKPTSGDDLISFQPVSVNRVLLTVNNVIYLLDLLHCSILNQRELTHVKTFQLLKSAVIDSEKSKNSKTIAIGVSTKNGPNPTSSLEIINIDVGTNTLKDSLGKSFQVGSNDTSVVLKPLFDDEDITDNAVKRDEVEGNMRVPTFQYNKVIEKLSALKNNDIVSFDDVFFKDLEVKEEHYTEKDRFISDPGFLNKVLDLIFEKFNRNDYPKVLTFLLTHPLFPLSRTHKLLSLLRDQPRLFKQAIVTCPNLPLNELLEELFSIRNRELLLDISFRILQDFTRDSIKQEMKKLSKLDIQNFIEFITNTDEDSSVENFNSSQSSQLFQLLSLVLDSIGLFSLEGALLEDLTLYIDKQVKIAEKNTELWNLIDTKGSQHGFATLNSDNTTSQKQDLPTYTMEYLDI